MSTKDTPMDYKPYEDAIKKLAFRCVQWGDGEITGYDNQMMDSLLPIIMRPLYEKFKQENQSLKLELQKQKELNAELVKRIKELTPRTSEKYIDNLTRKYGE